MSRVWNRCINDNSTGSVLVVDLINHWNWIVVANASQPCPEYRSGGPTQTTIVTLTAHFLGHTPWQHWNSLTDKRFELWSWKFYRIMFQSGCHSVILSKLPHLNSNGCNLQQIWCKFIVYAQLFSLHLFADQTIKKKTSQWYEL